MPVTKKSNCLYCGATYGAGVELQPENVCIRGGRRGLRPTPRKKEGLLRIALRH